MVLSCPHGTPELQWVVQRLVTQMNLMKRWEILNSKVIAFYQQGWYSVASSLAEETLEFAEKVFGPDHPNVAESLNNLALIYYTQGKEAEASILGEASPQPLAEIPSAKRSYNSQYLNQVVLLNLAKRKYALAESLFRRALEIKRNALGQEHSELLQVLGNLADLHNTRGNYDEAESYLKSLRVQGNNALQQTQMTKAEQQTQDSKELRHKREYMRCSGRFPAKLAHAKTGVSTSGVTENISQVGTFIKTKNWSAFRTNDQVSVAISLPSVFLEQKAVIHMEGPGIIARVDEEKEGVAIQFLRSFKQFKRMAAQEKTGIAGKIRYKMLAHYIGILENTSLTDFSNTYPKGFLIEKSRLHFDADVIFQFNTKQINVSGSEDEFSSDLADRDFSESRVIEISKRKIDSSEGVINIGRSPNNDIVLYNKTVSKSHAFIHFPSADGVAHLTDLQSTNYTFLNNAKIAPYEMYRLADGDEISFGPQTKVIYLSTETFCDFLTSIKRSAGGRNGS
jgi:tetratricopeptide (TPR) repeat protein